MGNSSTANNSDMEELVSDMPKPSAAYKRSAGLAVAGLAIFVALYFALAGWFLLTVYRLSFGADHASKGAIWGYAIAVCALFLAVFMLKAIFFVKHGKPDGLIEVTAKNQPRLFAFLYQLADSAGAPRPHKVFLSARVNASVFYDLSLLNLFFPSKKNLEIGLALVNTLRHGELRAVLAHEFGHFAQRAMAVGRWAYMAQQIAAHLVARRDKLDRFLVQLSTIDIRIGWVGWILRAIVWSIRSLVESIFNMVLLMQRALSREMEMQADLVAVSLTGSDALVHALHRLNAADDAWSRTLHFVFSERGRGRATRDVFAVQSHIIERMGAILNDAHYGEVPPMPGNHADEHRVFKVEMAQPPKMWLSHPLNHEREANAKRYYVYAPINKDSAWSLFDHPAQLRAELSAKLINDSQATQVALEESLQELGRQFKREHLKSRYCGIYFGRSVVRCEADPAHLRSDSGDILATDFHFLYPESLKEDVQNLRALETECEQLEAIKAGVLSAPGGVLRVRGKELQLSDLPHAILQVKDDIEAVELRLRKHDRLCRTWHYAAAEKVGKGWPEYLDGLLAILHYADHTEANLRDAQGLFNNTLHMVSAARRVTAKGAARVLREAGQLYPLLAAVYVQSKDIKLDPKLLAKLKVGSWSEALGDFKFSHPTKENLNDWIKVIDSWVDAAAGACGALRSCALEQLLIAETAITVLHMRPERAADQAPIAPKVATTYPTLLPGQERQRQTRLDWWTRFLTADGPLMGASRFVVAGGIVAAVLGLSLNTGGASVTVYNGLGRAVVVNIGSHKVNVAPFSSAALDIGTDKRYKIDTLSSDGQRIETFETDIRGSFSNAIYNVAGASPLVEWTAAYGNASAGPERPLGAIRWTTSDAGTLFNEPPRSISSKQGGGTRNVLQGMGKASPSQQLSMLKDDSEKQRLIALHARWDATSTPHALNWLALAIRLPSYRSILSARLDESPNDPVLLRTEQDGANDKDRSFICFRHQAKSNQAPNNGDLKYIALRCNSDQPDYNQKIMEAHKKWPENGWLAYLVGFQQAQMAMWSEAQINLEIARPKLPMMVDAINLNLARIKRMQATATPAELSKLAESSEPLSYLVALDSGQGLGQKDLAAYAELAQGNLEKALSLSSGSAAHEARVLRLVAASDGASSELNARALALPTNQGVDPSSVWVSYAFALSNRQNPAPFLKAAQGFDGKDADAIQLFLDTLPTSKNPADAEKLLDGLAPEQRGQAYSAGVVLLGSKAPQSWRDFSKRLLFASERPYFGQGA